MREMLLGAAKSYYVGLMNRHISIVAILLSNADGIGEHQDIQASIDAELDKIATVDDKLNIIVKYFERRKEDAKAEEETKSKSK